MTQAMKPCPFCGGEAHIKEIAGVCETLYTVGCSDSECMGYETLLCKPTPEEAITAWNRRAERTCHDMAESPRFFLCSECGWFWNDPEDELGFSYCPNCGARVVDE